MSVLDRFRLTGRRAFISGGSRGLGRAMAQSLAEAGADLVLVGRDEENLHQAQKEIAILGRHVDVLLADFGKPDEVEKACKHALEKIGSIDILINNVGGRRENVALEDQSTADWLRLMDLNLTSAVVATRFLGGAMVKRKSGRVINVASICGHIATRSIHGRHYETAKAGLVGFTRAMAIDWAPHGVTVNAIAPGTFLTDANRRWFKERPGFQAEIEALIPLGRLGNPEEIGPLAVYLASEASAFMTGAVLTMDGGFTVW